MNRIKAKRIGFTLSRLKSIKPDEGQIKRKFIYDTKTDGLRVQGSPTGTITFQFYKCKGHGATTISLGKLDKKTLNAEILKSVIEAANGHTAKITTDGADYIRSLQEKKAEETFGAMFEAWFANRVEAGKRDMDNCRGIYMHHIETTFAKRKPSTITTKQIEIWRTKLLKKKKLSGIGTISHTTANRCVQIIRAVYNRQLKGQHNPADDVENFDEHPRDRFLRGDELAKLFVALNDEQVSRNTKDLVLLALTTGARKNNLISMRWQDINFEMSLWTIPKGQSKNKKNMHIPLIPETMEILRSRKKAAKRKNELSPFVFSAKRGKSGYIGDPHRYWKQVLRIAGIDESIRFHDLRRTMGSYQASNGVSLHIIGKALGHSDSKATQIYAHLVNSDPVRDAMVTGFGAMKRASEKIANIK